MKKYLFILISLVLLAACGDDAEPEEVTEPEETEEVTEETEDVEEEPEEEVTEDTEEVEESEETAALSDDQIQNIESHLEGLLESDREFGDEFYLNDFEYDGESNRINARIDMQQDPLPETAEEIEEWAEAYAWGITMGEEEEYNVRVTLVTDLGDGEYIMFGHSYYDADSDDYSFEEESGMQLYN